MCFICNALCFYLLVILYAWYICAIIFNVVMSYDCMPYMCLAVLYVLSCMFSVNILCLFDRRFKSSIELVLFVLLCIVFKKSFWTLNLWTFRPPLPKKSCLVQKSIVWLCDHKSRSQWSQSYTLHSDMHWFICMQNMKSLPRTKLHYQKNSWQLNNSPLHDILVIYFYTTRVLHIFDIILPLK
jgi:hypothetical protein